MAGGSYVCMRFVVWESHGVLGLCVCELQCAEVAVCRNCSVQELQCAGVAGCRSYSVRELPCVGAAVLQGCSTWEFQCSEVILASCRGEGGYGVGRLWFGQVAVLGIMVWGGLPCRVVAVCDLQCGRVGMWVSCSVGELHCVRVAVWRSYNMGMLR